MKWDCFSSCVYLAELFTGLVASAGLACVQIPSEFMLMLYGEGVIWFSEEGGMVSISMYNFVHLHCDIPLLNVAENF